MDNITQINHFLYMGSFAHCAENTPEFVRLNIDNVLNFAIEIKPMPNPKINIVTFAIDDVFHPTLLDVIDEAELYLRGLIKNKKRIYLACSDGNSRAPAVLIYYLIKKKNMSYEDAYELIEKKRPEISLHPNFCSELHQISEISNY